MSILARGDTSPPMRFALTALVFALTACDSSNAASPPVDVPAPARVAVTSPPAESPAKRTLGPFDLGAASFDVEKLYPGRKVFYDNDTVTVQGATRRDVLVSFALAPKTKLVTEMVLYQRQPFGDFAKTHADAICADDVHAGTTCWRPTEPDLVYTISDPVLEGPFVEVPIAKVSGSAMEFVTWTPAKSPTVILGEGTRGPADHVPRDVIDRCARVLASTSACSYFYDPEFGFSKDRTRGRAKDAYEECDVLPPEDGEDWPTPVPDFSERVVVAIEVASKKGCKQLAAELDKHTLVNEKGPE